MKTMRILVFSCVVAVTFSGDCSDVDCDADGLDGNLYGTPEDNSGTKPKDCCTAADFYITGSGAEGSLVTSAPSGLEVVDDAGDSQTAACKTDWSAPTATKGTFTRESITDCTTNVDGKAQDVGSAPWTRDDFTTGEWTSHCKKDQAWLCSRWSVKTAGVNKQTEAVHASGSQNILQGRKSCKIKTAKVDEVNEYVTLGVPEDDDLAAGDLFCSKDDPSPGACQNDKVLVTTWSNDNGFKCQSCIKGYKLESTLCEPCNTAGVKEYKDNTLDSDDVPDKECLAKSCECGYKYDDSDDSCTECSDEGVKQEGAGAKGSGTDANWGNCGKDCSVVCDHDAGYHLDSTDADDKTCEQCTKWDSNWENTWTQSGTDECVVKKCTGGNGTDAATEVNTDKDDCDDCPSVGESNIATIEDNTCDYTCDQGYEEDDAAAGTCKACSHGLTPSSTGVLSVAANCNLTCKDGWENATDSDACTVCGHGLTGDEAGTDVKVCKITCLNKYYLDVGSDDDGADDDDEDDDSCAACANGDTAAGVKSWKDGNCELTCNDGYHETGDDVAAAFFANTDCEPNEANELTWNDGCADQTDSGSDAKTGASRTCCDDYSFKEGDGTVVIAKHDDTKDQSDGTICEKSQCKDNQIVVDKACVDVGDGRKRKSSISGWPGWDPEDDDANAFDNDETDSQGAAASSSDEKELVYDSWAEVISYTGTAVGFQSVDGNCRGIEGSLGGRYTDNAGWECDQEHGFTGWVGDDGCGGVDNDKPRYEKVQEWYDACPDDEFCVDTADESCGDKDATCHNTVRYEADKDGVPTNRWDFFGSCMDAKWYKLDNPFVCGNTGRDIRDSEDTECLNHALTIPGFNANGCGQVAGTGFWTMATKDECDDGAEAIVNEYAKLTTVTNAAASANAVTGGWAVLDDPNKCPENNELLGGCGLTDIEDDSCKHHFLYHCKAGSAEDQGDCDSEKNEVDCDASACSGSWALTEWAKQKTCSEEGSCTDEEDDTWYEACSSACEKFYKDAISDLKKDCTEAAGREVVVKGAEQAAAAAGGAFPSLVTFAGLIGNSVGLSVQQVIDVVNHKEGDIYTFGISGTVPKNHGRYAAVIFWDSDNLAKVESVAGDFTFLDAATITKLKDTIAALKEQAGGPAAGEDSPASTLYTVLALAVAAIFAL